MLVVFDLDGTLVDSRADIVRATNVALETHGRDPLPPALVTSFVGDGARTLMARAAGLGEEDPALEPLLASFLEYYTAHAALETRPVPHAVAVLETLAPELPLALCTNKPRQTTVRVLDALGLTPYFAAVRAGGDTPEKKPHPAPLATLARSLGFEPGSVVMVGDGPQDIECARRAGARSVAIQGNIVAREVLERAGPNAWLAELRELLPLLRRFRAQATKR